MPSRAVLTVAMLLAGPVLAQGSASTGQAMPDSNMGPLSGNRGAANNGIGQQGRLTGNAGSHSSSLKGAAAAAQIPISPKRTAKPDNDPRVEGDPNQAGAKPH